MAMRNSAQRLRFLYVQEGPLLCFTKSVCSIVVTGLSEHSDWLGFAILGTMYAIVLCRAHWPSMQAMLNPPVASSLVECENTSLDVDTEVLANERDYFLSSSFRTIQAPAGFNRL
jgi:hypothetical protein